MSLGLQIAGLWRSPLADGWVTSFERAWTDDIAQRRTPAPDEGRLQAYWALKADLKRAWGLNDLKTVAGVGLVLHRARTLNDMGREQLAEALLAQGRFGEAFEVLASSAGDDHAHWLQTARASAGLGDFNGAREAVRTAAARLARLRPEEVPAAIHGLGARRTRLDLALGSLEARQEAREQLEAGRPEAAAERLTAWFEQRLARFGQMLELLAKPAADWGASRDQVAGQLILGLADPAADTLEAALLAAPPPADELRTALYLARAIAAASAGERQPALLRTVRTLFRGAKGRFLDIALDILDGRASWRDLAEAPRPIDHLQLLVATALARAGHPRPAIALLGRFTLEHPDRQPVRRELVMVCGQESLNRVRIEPQARPGAPRIIDIFPYNGELEVLKLKLHETSPWVDHFVIFEAEETYSGRPKPIFLPGQRAEIADYLPKITHVVTSPAPDHVASAWAREYHQRDEAIAALQGLCAPDDLILLTDTDEIVDGRRLQGFQGEFAVLKLAQQRYFFNYRRVDAAWPDSGNLIVLRARHLRDISYGVARTLLPAPLGPNRIEAAGWHFTSIGDARAVARKLGSYAHEENVGVDDETRLADLMARIRAGDLQPGWERCALEDLPAYIRDNRERLKAFLL